ncbi:hypothetical protein E4U32_002935 [Claviceps aff. humidiphila group G2b]|nr:hypothetical protein E4U32_002935 [Claviceps aff. humidiphila group G2b]
MTANLTPPHLLRKKAKLTGRFFVGQVPPRLKLVCYKFRRYSHRPRLTLHPGASLPASSKPTNLYARLSLRLDSSFLRHGSHGSTLANVGDAIKRQASALNYK